MPILSRLFIALLFLGLSVSAKELREPVAGRAWIRLDAATPLSYNLAQVRLPANGHIQRALILPQQCLSLQTQAMQQSSTAQLSPAPQGSTDRKRIAELEQQLLRTFVVEFDTSMLVQEFCKAARAACPNIELCTPVYHNDPQFSPNDPKLSQQGYLQAIGAFEAWDVTRGDSNIVIAIIDDGARRTHEDLRNSIAINKGEIPNNALDDDNNGYVDDYAGLNFFATVEKTAGDDTYNSLYDHGTCVASICAATQDNSLGYSGVAGKCRFIPIKASISANGKHHIDAGYESILYATLRGAQVINCSWGNYDQGFNPLEQSIIDYALSRGTCVIASCGNKDEYNSYTSPFYPAAYRGVLGVGETNVQGQITDGSTYGSHCHIFAPGASIYTAANTQNDAYTDQAAQPFSGTSSAAPIVSGVAALVRHKFPQLSAEQLCEHVRVNGTSVSDQNPTLRDFAVPQVDAKKALTTDPMSSAAIRVTQTTLKNTRGEKIETGMKDDTVLVVFDLHNYLGTATDLQFRLRSVDPTGSNSVQVLDSTQNLTAMARNADTTLRAFRVLISHSNSTRAFLRLDISAISESSKEYRDFALVEFYATKDFVDITDGQAVLSIGDFGWIGSNQYTTAQRKGSGYSSRRFGSLLYRGGIICSSDESKGRSGLGSDGSLENAFAFVRRTSGMPYVLSFGDAEMQSDLRLGITVQSSFSFLPASLVLCDVVVENSSFNTLNNFALGYFLDWDLTAAGDSCFVRRFSEAELSNQNSAAELEYRANTKVVTGALAICRDSNTTVQAAGLNVDFTSGNFPPEKMYEALHSGTTIQLKGPDDMSMLIGAHFRDPFKPGQKHHIRFVFGMASTPDSLVQLMHHPSVVDVPIEESHSSIALQPMPADQHLRIENSDFAIREIQVFNMMASCVQKVQLAERSYEHTLSVHELPSGEYMIRIIGDAKSMLMPFIVVH